jgi:hypothetical protein
MIVKIDEVGRSMGFVISELAEQLVSFTRMRHWMVAHAIIPKIM